MATRATSNPWDLTRENPEDYSAWKEQARNGETLQGFADWLISGQEEAEQ